MADILPLLLFCSDNYYIAIVYSEYTFSLCLHVATVAATARALLRNLRLSSPGRTSRAEADEPDY